MGIILKTIKYLLDAGCVDLDSQDKARDVWVMVHILVRDRQWVVLKFIIPQISTTHYLEYYSVLNILRDIISGHARMDTFQQIYEHLTILKPTSNDDNLKLIRDAIPNLAALSILKFLLARSTIQDWTQLLYGAVTCNRPQALDLLLAESKFASGHVEGGSLLTVALNQNLLEVAGVLVRRGLIPDIKQLLVQDDYSLLHTAIRNKHLETVDFILQHLNLNNKFFYERIVPRRSDVNGAKSSLPNVNIYSCSRNIR